MADYWRQEQRQNYDRVYNQPHEAQFSHEAVAGGAAFMGMREWEKHQERQGQPVNHQFAKEALVGLVGGEVDRLFETKGLDYIDREKTKRHAVDQAQSYYDQQYGNRQEGEPYGCLRRSGSGSSSSSDDEHNRGERRHGRREDREGREDRDRY